ncbi:MAG: bifunctional 4-hydroxy-3-methylbut-2-enyl diphosphate reductase/30S ribosomal protein S1 [Eubacteriales bacterium]|nr:bifunctional 4-hydroxy-3-methylbut-2-enyl diphosphate reductase/30S ribosomal protein S1 [Eubacteriales bacterium]
MKINLAKSAGFCFGVKRAISIAYETADKQKKSTVYTLGPLIHNAQVIDKLRLLGIFEADRVEDISKGSTVIIRTHGVAPEIYDQLERINANVIDATCPYVRKIHKIVKEYHNKGYKTIIFGDPNHPEVQGINGWCENCAEIVQDLHEFECKANGEKICLVAQTTSSKEIWEKIKKNAKTSCKEVLIFDTICSATDERQSEAKKMAENSDCMIVIGGRHSSNTKKLFDICSSICPETYHVETASELPKSVFDKCIIGVTAGASTPEWIIKEVINFMSEKTTMEEMNFVEELESTLVNPTTGDIVKGTVIGITPTEVYVDIGFKMDGVITADELSSDSDLKPEEVVKIGQEIEAFVYRVSDKEGVVGLSVRKLAAIESRKKLEEALETKEILTGKVIDAVRGGVIVLYNESRVFIPASQASDRYLQDLSSLVGTKVQFRITEINPRRRKVVGSIKSVLQEVKQKKFEEFWANAEVGKEYEGVVKSITDFGAFVDIGGIDGLIHISELSWSMINHPSEVLNVGDNVKVYILSLSKEDNRVSLGYKRPEDNPWIKAQAMYNVGDVVKVKIVRLVSFGAFAELLPSVDGLIHISQISTERIPNPSSVLSVGQEVEAKIIAIDWENKKISLSIRALLEPQATEEVAQETEDTANTADGEAQKEETGEEVTEETAEE